MATDQSRQFTNPEAPGYVGFANLPNQVHRKSVKKGFEFTLMVVGESGLGKSTLINSLFLADLYPERHIPAATDKIVQTLKIEPSSVEIEERGVKLRLTVVDTPGYGDAINNNDCFKPIQQYIDEQYELYLKEENGLNRRNISDSRVHCVFYFISPCGHGLKPLDIEFMKSLHNKVNIVPIISKADTLTQVEAQTLKKTVLDQIADSGVHIYTIPSCDDDEDDDYKEQCIKLRESVPFAVIGANTTIEVRGKRVRGRQYPWGVVEIENPEHSDFIKLRTMLITHMQDLQELTHETHYENYRAVKLAKTGGKSRGRVLSDSGESSSYKLQEKDKLLQEKEVELKKMQEMIAKMQAQMSDSASICSNNSINNNGRGSIRSSDKQTHSSAMKTRESPRHT